MLLYVADAVNPRLHCPVSGVLETSLRVVQRDAKGYGIEAPSQLLFSKSVTTQTALLQSQYNDAIRTIESIKVGGVAPVHRSLSTLSVEPTD